MRRCRLSGTDSGERGEWNLAAQLNSLDEFLKRVEPFIDRSGGSGLIEPHALYRSLQFSCMAARSGHEWILVAGGAALSADPCASNSSISPVFHNNSFVLVKRDHSTTG